MLIYNLIRISYIISILVRTLWNNWENSCLLGWLVIPIWVLHQRWISEGSRWIVGFIRRHLTLPERHSPITRCLTGLYFGLEAINLFLQLLDLRLHEVKCGLLAVSQSLSAMGLRGEGTSGQTAHLPTHMPWGVVAALVGHLHVNLVDARTLKITLGLWLRVLLSWLVILNLLRVFLIYFLNFLVHTLYWLRVFVLRGINVIV
jgi:hypothetical protein